MLSRPLRSGGTAGLRIGALVIVPHDDEAVGVTQMTQCWCMAGCDDGRLFLLAGIADIPGQIPGIDLPLLELSGTV